MARSHAEEQDFRGFVRPTIPKDQDGFTRPRPRDSTEESRKLENLGGFVRPKALGGRGTEVSVESTMNIEEMDDRFPHPKRPELMEVEAEEGDGSTIQGTYLTFKLKKNIRYRINTRC
jgi:hypothetical protein